VNDILPAVTVILNWPRANQPFSPLLFRPPNLLGHASH
jgi:hypothetical protein